MVIISVALMSLDLDIVKEYGNEYLSMSDLEPVPRFKLLTEVLGKNASNGEVADILQEVEEVRWVKDLEDEQQDDGGWQRFHSRDTKVRAKVPTSEYAIERALALGLPLKTKVLTSAHTYMGRILKEEIPFPDPPESNPRWQWGTQLFTAAYMSRLEPHHEELIPHHQVWMNIVESAFQSGIYRLEDELSAHEDLTGLEDVKYLRINSKYHVMLIQAIQMQMEPELLTKYIDWLLHEGIGYIHPNRAITPIPLDERPSYLDTSWFASLELLAGFDVASSVLKNHVDWIYTSHVEKHWDFFGRSPSSVHFPYSKSWKDPENVTMDWSTRVLVLLKKILT